MRKVMRHKKVSFAFVLISLVSPPTPLANTRTLEFPFGLSADIKSEFSSKFAALSAGRIIIEANWNSRGGAALPVSLNLILIRPDGSEAARKTGSSLLQIEYRATEQEIANFIGSRNSRWTVRLLNNADEKRHEVTGKLRITVPARAHLLEDTQFTLLGSGNAQEIPFVVPAPGRISVEAAWQADSLSATASAPLTLSLIHSGQSRTYARRLGSSPLRIEHQVTELELDRGSRWIVRVQNDSQIKLKGRLKVIYTPGL